jgi:hypothetical protein
MNKFSLKKIKKNIIAVSLLNSSVVVCMENKNSKEYPRS